jgi:hypothetical protein
MTRVTRFGHARLIPGYALPLWSPLAMGLPEITLDARKGQVRGKLEGATGRRPLQPVGFMAGSTGLEPATSGLTERDADEPSVLSKWGNLFTSLAVRQVRGAVALLDIVGNNGAVLKHRWHGLGQSHGDETSRCCVGYPGCVTGG